VISDYAQAIQFQWERNAPKQVSHEHQAPIQHCDHGQFTVAVIVRNLPSQFIEPLMDCRLVKQHALDVGLHQLIRPLADAEINARVFASNVIFPTELVLVMSSEVACQAVALCEGLETSLIDRTAAK
jgi:hypothetical protein